MGSSPIAAAIAADFLAGIPTLMKSWTHPQTETVYSYVGAVVSMGIVLLTITDWTFEVAAFPIFVLCSASVDSVLIGLEPGPRLARARQARVAEPAAPG